jgi:transposase
MGRQANVEAGQRKEAVLALLRREEPATALARRYGISEQTLYRWRDEFLAGGEAALKGTGGNGDERRRIDDLVRQLADRDQVIGELTIANRLLKKMSDRSR